MQHHPCLRRVIFLSDCLNSNKQLHTSTILIKHTAGHQKDMEAEGDKSERKG